MKKFETPYLILFIILGGITITTVLAETDTNITSYPYVITDGSNQRLVIISSGNVGIGTANPLGVLNVNGASGTPTKTIIATAGSQYLSLDPSECQGCENSLVQSGDQALIFGNGQQNGGNLVIGNWNTGAAGMRITGNGNVGIGTANPLGVLNVNGASGTPTSTIIATAGSQYLSLDPSECQGCVNALIQSGDQALIFGNGQQNGGNLVIGNWNTGAAGMRITGNGNVGIGTANPSQSLDVNGNVRLTGNIISPNDICIGTC